MRGGSSPSIEVVRSVPNLITAISNHYSAFGILFLSLEAYYSDSMLRLSILE